MRSMNSTSRASRLERCSYFYVAIDGPGTLVQTSHRTNENVRARCRAIDTSDPTILVRHPQQVLGVKCRKVSVRRNYDGHATRALQPSTRDLSEGAPLSCDGLSAVSGDPCSRASVSTSHRASHDGRPHHSWPRNVRCDPVSLNATRVSSRFLAISPSPGITGIAGRRGEERTRSRRWR